MTSVRAGGRDVDEVIEAVNRRFDALFARTAGGHRAPHVCCVCDEIILSQPRATVLSRDDIAKKCSWLRWKILDDGTTLNPFSGEEVDSLLVKHCRCPEQTAEQNGLAELVDGLCLSPRSTWQTVRGKGGLTC